MQKTPSIILIEDEDQQREVLHMVFESQGYSIRSVSTAEEALIHLDAAGPDLIVTDVKLPGIDGFTFCEQVREHAKFQNLPFVFITGYNDLKVIARVKDLGSVGYITKPYDIETLIDVVKKYISVPEA
ncbi:MAG: response regulator [Ignavibacteriae bacterium]|nr:response regulator [Ignavibacteria bacterium]MBI3365541.1 response regulator [Ignavibacteriota bacterium]